MAEIPEDIIKAADSALISAILELDNEDGNSVAIIAKAILAERERCASLVEGYEITLLEYPSEEAAEYYVGGADDALLAAADAIRKSPTPSTPPKTGV